MIYTIHILILVYKWTFSSSLDGSVYLANKKLQFIYSVVKELDKLNLEKW